MYLTNVPTLENFALILFFSVLVGTSFSRLVWVRRTFHVVGSFDENTSLSCHGTHYPGSCGSPWFLRCFDQRCWNLVNLREHLNLYHLCNFVSFLLCVSQSVFETIQRILACPCADGDTHQSRSVVKFCVAQFLRCCVSFFLSLKGGHFCIVVASYGHVSLNVDQLDWQCCRSHLLHCCGVVEGSLVSRCET